MNVESSVANPVGMNATGPEFWNIETRRAYLGCYFIGVCWVIRTQGLSQDNMPMTLSRYSILTRRVNPMGYNEYFQACAMSLGAEKQIPSDADLLYLLQFSHEAEQVYDTFTYTESSGPHHMNDERMQVYINVFSSRINEWRLTLPSSLSNDGKYQHLPKYVLWNDHATVRQKLWLSIFEAFTREIGLYGISKISTPSMPRVTILLDSLMHVTNYLDTLLTIPISGFASLTSAEWSLINYAILLTMNISVGIQSPIWNIEVARSTIKLEIYIDALSVRLKELSSTVVSADGLTNWYAGLLLK